jgi:hypothetical protein
MDSVPEIKTISHPVVLRYFETLNAEAFDQTSELFAIGGILQPPFEKPVVGREAIAQYLKQEARGLIVEPHQGSSHLLDNGNTEFQIIGKVQTPVFGVNVAWQFVLSPADELLFAKVKLIASPQELLNLRR